MPLAPPRPLPLLLLVLSWRRDPLLCELSVGVGGRANFAEVEPNDIGRPWASMMKKTGDDDDDRN
jgi:hypothetical protein